MANGSTLLNREKVSRMIEVLGFKKNDSRLVGILGTLIIHLLAAIIFMIFQISTIQKQNTEIFTVEFEEIIPDEAEKEDEKIINLPPTSVEKILQGDNEMLNIARNLANESEAVIDPKEYIDMVKEEMIKNGQLSENNYIDEQKLPEETEVNENLSVQNEKPDPVTDEIRKSQEMAANYKGPTRIYYDVQGRNHIHLPIPIYMCEGSGKVTLSIEINQSGYVTDSDVLAGESTTSDPCLVETAMQTAMISRFNPDMSAPKTQKGTLTYHFVAQ